MYKVKLFYWQMIPTLLTACVLLAISTATSTSAVFKTTAKISQAVFGVLKTQTVPEVFLQLTQNQRVIAEVIQNGSFDGLGESWLTGGEVSFLSIRPGETSNRSVAQLGSSEGTANPVISEISQRIDFGATPIAAVSFWYQVWSREDLLGFDDPCVSFFLDEQLLWEAKLQGLEMQAQSDAKSSNWQQVVVPLPQILGNHTLSFRVSNTLDDQKPTWVYLDDVTTQSAVIKKNTLLNMYPVGDNTLRFISYWMAGKSYQTPIRSFPSAYFAAVSDQNSATYQIIQDQDVLGEGALFFDGIAPELVGDLSIMLNSDSTFTLSWTAPSDQNPFSSHQAVGYEIRLARNYLDLFSNWFSLQLLQPEMIANSESGQQNWLPAQVVGGQESWDFPFNESINNTYLAVRSFDAAGNFSPVSNLVQILR